MAIKSGDSCESKQQKVAFYDALAHNDDLMEQW